MRIALRTMTFAALMVLSVIYVTSCSKDDRTTPTPTQITVTPPQSGSKAVTLAVSDNILPADGITATLIQAFCTIGGSEASPGLIVNFITDFGEFSVDGATANVAPQNKNVNVSTGGGGVAQIYLISDTVGRTATVKALFANDAAASAFIKFEEDVTIANIGSIEIALTPSSGQSPLTSEANVTILSEEDEPMQGILVRFRISDEAALFDRKKMKTDTNGKAITFITNIKKDAVVTATASGYSATGTITISNDLAKDLTLEVLNSSGGLAGQDPVLINERGKLLLKVTVSGDTGPIKNAQVTFNSSDSNTSFSKQTARTDSNGELETFANNILTDSMITAVTDGANDDISVKINSRPVPSIGILSGSPTADEVNIFTLTADGSYDPDEPYGDKIATFTWAATINSSVGATMTISNTENPQLITYTIGTFGGLVPTSGDVVTIFLTVIDSLGLQQTATREIVF